MIIIYKIGVRTHFDAAHLLRNYPGKCQNLHGHRWEVEAVLSGSQIDEFGTLVDFSIIKSLLEEIVDWFDHKNVAEVPPFDKINPTAENIARVIFNDLNKKIPSQVILEEIRVWESPECWSSYGEDKI